MDATLPALIQQMLQPEFYDHPVQEPIRLLQTHISYVLLTGELAYKIKKPANFGFLDFTTLDQRQHFCQEELRLNRRLSPALYLQVRPIAEVAGRYQWADDDSDAIAEYAVQMRQFPQDGLFSYLFAQGQLTPAMMQTLGQQVAAFHQTAATNPDIQAFGSVSAVQQVDDNNHALSEGFIGRTQTQEQYDQTRAFSHEFFAKHADWFEQRQQAGKVRECHGDLHLNNICLYQDQIQVFDCIEFNQEFRNIDVLYDVAFMVMDLEFQGRADLANLFLNIYLEETGDYEGAALLPLYLSMRAYIRGNVNSLALNDPAISEAEKQDFQQRGQAYYHSAWQYTQRDRGQIVAMCGLSGSGKSTVARSLAPRLKAIHIRSDAVRKHLAGVPLQQRAGDEFGSGIYTPEMTQKTYQRLQDLGLHLAAQGWTVILDAKYDRAALRQSLQGAAAAQDIPLHLLVCEAPVEILRDRLDQRAGDIADATAAMIDQQRQAWEPLTVTEQPQALHLKTSEPIEPQLELIQQRLLAAVSAEVEPA